MLFSSQLCDICDSFKCARYSPSKTPQHRFQYQTQLQTPGYAYTSLAGTDPGGRIGGGSLLGGNIRAGVGAGRGVDGAGGPVS